MVTIVRIVAGACLAVIVSGCGGSLQLHIRAVEEDGRSVVLPRGAEEPVGQPIASVRFFFYPYVSDSVIHPVPEREFVTDSAGRSDFTEKLSPSSDKMGALVAMKSGYFVDTLYFHYAIDDTLNILVRLRRR